MVTTLRGLLRTVVDSAAHGEPDEAGADAAIAAAGQLGRALGQLADTTNRSGAAGARRRLVVGELERACRAAATQWPTPTGRAVDLAAAAVDHIGRESLTLAADQRWAAATEVACAVRQLAATAGQFGPYSQVPALLRVQRLSDVVGQVQVLDEPSVQARAVLDRLVPGGPLDRSASAGDVAAHPVHAVNTAVRDREFTIAASLTVAAAAESVAEQAAALASAFHGEASARPVWAQTAQTWRVLHAATRRFDDGSRYAAPTATADEAATQMRWAVNQLPALAGQVEQALTRAVAGGKLFAPARALPRSEDRAGDHIRNWP